MVQDDGVIVTLIGVVHGAISSCDGSRYPSIFTRVNNPPHAPRTVSPQMGIFWQRGTLVRHIPNSRRGEVAGGRYYVGY